MSVKRLRQRAKVLLIAVPSLFVLSAPAFGQQMGRSELAKQVHEPGYHASQLEIESQYVPIGQTAPALNSMIVYGDSSEALHPKGRLLLLEFWFAGCSWCREMSRELSRIDSEYGPRGLTTLGVDPYDWDSSKFEQFCRDLRPSYPSLMVTHRAQLDYGLVAYPMIYLLDEHRKVIYRKVGHSPEQIVELQAFIDAHLK